MGYTHRISVFRRQRGRKDKENILGFIRNKQGTDSHFNWFVSNMANWLTLAGLSRLYQSIEAFHVPCSRGPGKCVHQYFWWRRSGKKCTASISHCWRTLSGSQTLQRACKGISISIILMEGSPSKINPPVTYLIPFTRKQWNWVNNKKKKLLIIPTSSSPDCPAPHDITQVCLFGCINGSICGTNPLKRWPRQESLAQCASPERRWLAPLS